MIKLAHISSGLRTGGAEVQLMRIIAALDKTKFEMMVISLDQETYLADRIRELGVPVHSLSLKQTPLALWRGFRVLREFNPDVIHGTMYEGGVFGTMCRRFLPKRPHVIWTVHEPLDHYDQMPMRKQLQVKLWGKLSGSPECLMYVSHLNKEQHVDWGFNNSKAVVIPNGVDTTRFGPARETGHISNVRRSFSGCLPASSDYGRRYNNRSYRCGIGASFTGCRQSRCGICYPSVVISGTGWLIVNVAAVLWR